MKVGDRVVIGRSAWLYGDLGNVTTGLFGIITRGPEQRPWGVGVNVRLSADELDKRMGRKIPWFGVVNGTVEMTFNAKGVDLAQPGAKP